MRRTRLGGVTIALLALVSARAPADPMEPFTVTGIRIEGLQRITEGTLLNQLPVNIGDVLDAQHVREALRAVNATGFFRDVEMRREAPGVLVVVVQERPSIREFKITGNKELKTEDLTKSLNNVGLARGKILNRATLDDVRQFLIDQYFSRGRYGVVVDTSVDEAGGNLVDVKIDIKEGKTTKVRSINIVGNERFGDQELEEHLELKSHNLLSFYKGDDRYSRETLQGDLEKIRSYYMDRGYANFEITSTQVALAPEKDDLFVTVNVFEGTVFRIGAVKMAGKFVLPEEILRLYLRVKDGDTFSQKAISDSEEALKNKLGESGYSFAEVTAVPLPDGAGRIALTFEIEPNARTYVRHIEFNGVDKTNDEVLRREFRQLEGAALSNVAVQRSEERIQHLPYIKSVKTETRKVEGTPDLVDIAVDVEEGPSSQLGGGIGYSERQSVMLQGNFIDSNFLGSGERVALDLNGGNYSKTFQLQHTDPYFTVNNVSRTISGGYQQQERLTSSFSQFSTKTWSAGTSLAYPLSEAQYLNFGVNLSHADLATVLSSSTQLRDWVRNNGDDYFRRVGNDAVLGTIVDTVELSASWLYDSRNRSLFPTRGASHRLQFTITPPGGSVSYMSATYRGQQFFHIPLPLIDRITFTASGDIGWGKALGDTTDMPPNRHVFTGGADSVRGFRDASLGPRDSLGNPYGGDAGLSAQFEAIIPLPDKFQTSARASLFVDTGQSFYLGNTGFRNRRGDRVSYPFDLNELRWSTGVAVQWLSPMGLFRFSYAVPLVWQKTTRRVFGDELENFQFSVGTAF